jgi:uncharacterized membrane protein YbjE (DUF340 family)
VKALRIILGLAAAYMAIASYGTLRAHGIEVPTALGLMVACGVGYYSMAVDLLRSAGARV